MAIKSFLGGVLTGSILAGSCALYQARNQQREYLKGLDSLESQSIQCGKIILNELSDNLISKYVNRDLESSISMEFVNLRKKINDEKIKYVEF